MMSEFKPEPVRRSSAELLVRDIIELAVKITAIAAIAALLFTFVFGIFRNTDPSMSPAIQDGDLVIYYRLDRDYTASDVAVVKYRGNTLALRVAAVAGDEVDIREEGLFINGSLQQEMRIYEATYRYDTGVDFPITVQEGQIFVLGDSRENAADSRVFGAVDVDDTYGTVMTLIRRRNI